MARLYWNRDKMVPSCADAGQHRADREQVGLALLVAPRADHVATKEVPGFVGDDSRQLRFVAHPQEQAGKDDGEPGREHHRIEVRDPREIDAEVLGGGPAHRTDQVAQVAGELGIGHQQVRAGNLLLDPVHFLPQPDLVALGRFEARADKRDHVLRPDARDRRAGVERSNGSPSADQQRAAA
jgi:hypothetical protein